MSLSNYAGVLHIGFTSIGKILSKQENRQCIETPRFARMVLYFGISTCGELGRTIHPQRKEAFKKPKFIKKLYRPTVQISKKIKVF